MLPFLPLLTLWDDVTADTIGTTAEWTSKCELADVDGDGWVDILFPNGGDYSSGGAPETQRVFRNLGNWSAAPPHFEEISSQVFGAAGTRLSRVIKVRDIDGDGDDDVFVGGAWGTASGLFRRDANGWTDVSASLPSGNVALGDAEFGDVDGDGDLDLVLADVGTNVNNGGPTRLWLNDGSGAFTDATSQMPSVAVAWSWDMELADIDDDGDLDVLVSCKLCAGGKAFVNDGTGHFTDDSARLPQHTNNYEYEPMDVDGDGDLDLVTINDGPNDTETLLINDGTGHFADETSSRITGNPAEDDNVDTFGDFDGDGDADWIIGSLSGADRLMVNDGSGHFTTDTSVMTLATPGTLGLQVADLDQDGRLDVVQSQGEVAFPDKVLLANSGVVVDRAPPDVRIIGQATVDDPVVVARASDRKSPSIAADWNRIDIELTAPGTTQPIHMQWRGEYEWAATLPNPTPGLGYRVCAVDAQGNQACSENAALPGGDAGPGDDTGGGGGCCSTSGGSGSWVLALLTVAALRRKLRA